MMTSVNVKGVDTLVEEYLIHRGFTQTFRLFQKEKKNDRTHGFHAIKIVEQIYHYIESFQISDFIDLWDFLSKRFFMHLDQENLFLLDSMKCDLIKFYLVNAVLQNKKKAISQFFETYSHEIIADSGNSTQQLRSWYALPYMSDPEKDIEFGPYFSKKWSEELRLTLHNFLSTILFNTPSPKLLLLEKWFRSDAQEETRRHIRETSEKINESLHREDKLEDRIFALQRTIRDLVEQIHESNKKDIPSELFPRGSVGEGQSFSDRETLMDFNEDITLTACEKIFTLGQSVCELASSCLQHSHLSSTHHHERNAVDRSHNCRTQSKLNCAIEKEMLAKIQNWLELCSGNENEAGGGTKA